MTIALHACTGQHDKYAYSNEDSDTRIPSHRLLMCPWPPEKESHNPHTNAGAVIPKEELVEAFVQEAEMHLILGCCYSLLQPEDHLCPSEGFFTHRFTTVKELSLSYYIGKPYILLYIYIYTYPLR